jgi:hypothetical protein
VLIFPDIRFTQNFNENFEIYKFIEKCLPIYDRVIIKTPTRTKPLICQIYTLNNCLASFSVCYSVLLITRHVFFSPLIFFLSSIIYYLIQLICTKGSWTKQSKKRINNIITVHIHSYIRIIYPDFCNCFKNVLLLRG